MRWVRINGMIKFKDSFERTVHCLGKPDSMVSPNYSTISNSYYDKNFKYCYFKGFKFEKYKNTVVLRNVEFNSTNIYLFYPKIRFSNSITLAEINRKLPKIILDTLGGSDMDKRSLLEQM